MNFVKNSDVFRHQLEIINRLFKRDRRLPDRVLTDRLICGGFIEEFLISRSFFDQMKAFVGTLGEEKFYLAVIVPEPNEYFFSDPASHPIIEMSTLDTSDEYLQLLQGEYRGDSLVGAMAYQAQVTLFYSDSATWGLHIDNRDLEIGVAGFSDARIKSLFVSAYDPKYVFTAKEVIEVVVENVFIHVPGGVPDDIREQLIINYPEERFGSSGCNY